MTGLTRDMVLDRTRLLARITRRELTVVTGLYERSETAASYVEAAALLNDDFDVSGLPGSFCPDCEHDPCVAGGARWCAQDPRFITVQAIGEEIYRLTYELIPADGGAKNRGLILALVAASRGLTWNAWDRETGESWLRQLVYVRGRLREAKEAKS